MFFAAESARCVYFCVMATSENDDAAMRSSQNFTLSNVSQILAKHGVNKEIK